MLKRVFVSYSSLNAEPVRGLAADIESLGHDAWLDRELSGGQRWWDQILKEIRDCDAFVFAVSAAAADSRACLSELAYAEALGKPVLPITVEPGFAESLLPPAIAELQRVDYTTQDKVAFSALNRALSKRPPAPPSPDIPPEAPPVPASYLFDLKTAIADPGVMSAERQNELLKELRARLGHGHSRADVLALVRQFRRRDDVLVRIDRALAEFEAEVEAGEASAARTGAPGPIPVATPAGVHARSAGARAKAGQHATAEPATAESAGNASVSPAATPIRWMWWIFVIFFGFIGGIVAFVVNREANPRGARKLLIGSVISSLAWMFLSLLAGT
jgi:TIR domain